MGRLIVSAQMTMDGVMDQLEGWFEVGTDSAEDGLEQLRAADALVLGRGTYEHLASAWSAQRGPWADLINPLPKHVASRTLGEPLGWNARLLGPDVADAVAALKQEHAGTLLIYGCGQLANDLARRGLVDEVRLWLHPIVFGDGVRPFHAGLLPVRMRLIRATTYTSGVVGLAYEPLPE
jgi:dihydrofolate reductase